MNFLPKQKAQISLIILFLVSFFSPLKIFAQTITPADVQPTAVREQATPLPTPSGQVISLIFKVPGIGAEGENGSPRNVTRTVRLYFFSPDINVEDTTTTPIGSVETSVEFDSDTQSLTYGKFTNLSIDLGSKIPDGKYQIVFKMDQALSKLIKEDAVDIGGKIFDISNSYTRAVVIDGQEIIIGDIHPSVKGDNVMDINDYNELVSCFGTKAESLTCLDNKATDLNDDGKIDGVDYNLMFGSFKILLAQGKPVPDFILPKPTSKPTQAVAKPSVSPTPKKTVVRKASTQEKGGSIVLPIIIALLVIGIGGIAFWKRRKTLDFLSKLLHKNSPPPADIAPEADTQPTPATSTDEAVDKEYFVKKQTEDTINNTTVLTLTDDNGPTLGYYSGKDVADGFFHVKGILKKEGDKVFIDVSEMTPVEQVA
ncbi:MAG TPA: hypothetical protein VNA13_01645 [Xanthomonadales bacterium]|nr:hypothetical protein [Xanthomonadales bacterium]